MPRRVVGRSPKQTPHDALMELSHPPRPTPACLIATAPADLHFIRACAVSL